MPLILLRTIFLYTALLFLIRISGKRQIGELQLSELITTLMLSELAVLPIADPDTPITDALLPILCLLCLEYLISALVSRKPTLRKFFFGAPCILIHNGKLNLNALRKVRLGIGELLSELRLKNIADIGDVQCAILEDNGQLSVFPYAAASPLTPRDCGISAEERGVALPLVISGSIMHDTMKHIGITETWLTRTLKRRGFAVRDILLMTIDQQKNTIYILDNRSSGQIFQMNERDP